ncbi:MAG: YfcC family protein [Oscillospiraceae bacterium]|nr:YfcC family protein [Oscillospiraceae bacterium]
MTENKGLNVSVKSFLGAILVILALMIGTYALTFLIPAGEYARTTDAAGNTVIVSTNSFRFTEGGLSFGKFLLSPVLVLAAEGGGTIIAIIVFLLVIGGVFNALESCGLMEYMLQRLVHRFAAHKYRLIAVVPLFFMSMGAFIGSFEECVPLVPIVVALSVGLGWDAVTGLGMSLLAAGCGFASGVCNPFTIGVAQSLAGLPMFSGLWLRLVSAVLIYALLLGFLYRHAKAIDTGIVAQRSDFIPVPALDKALMWFVCILGGGIALVLCSPFIPALQDLTMIIVAVMFLAAGLTGSLTAGMTGGSLAKSFGKGMLTILPAVLMICMASSVKYILTEAKILDTLLYMAVQTLDGMPKWGIALAIYAIVLGMNFFIASGSAKAFLLIPLIVPMAQLFGIPAQLCMVAFAFGDGFSNVFYPTNAALLIALGLADVPYGSWVKYSWKFQGANLLLTSAILLFGLWVGYC